MRNPTILPFKPNRYYQANQLVSYQTVIGGIPVRYVLRSKFNGKYEEFNPVYFENTTPKTFAISSGSVLPQDTIIRRGIGKVKNESLGWMSVEEAELTLSSQSGHTEQIWLNGLIREFNIDLYPKTNPNEPIVEYGWVNTTKTTTIIVEEIQDEVVLNFTIKEQVYNLYQYYPSRFIIRFYDFDMAEPMIHAQTPDSSTSNTYTRYADYYLNNVKDSVQSFKIVNQSGTYTVYKL